ncbi:splicing factor, arginine/serine-rich 19 [Tachysurus vachellii]|uniref:splicing factor, arginine/serine-rich 19 n=1 Tax=Tachysurus vachellii TaxID=175792 RepID=UPI00296AA097|nr:splicing factor, arginine/serine-rich 19 [Tachysurus vachellii]XP_060749326.1 splicing factor, arginine/serine-rich 19 [Tachysurus vachellii]XP_060749327.1 splicing factor, arginine/serine-rich 19 [Tachysurus vachellii]
MSRPSPLCTSQRAAETAKSPLHSSPSTSPTSPSSAPSSPSSHCSTSPRRMGMGYRGDEDGSHAGNSRVRKGGGDGVSSTSTLASSLLSAPPLASLHRLSSSPHPYDAGQREGVDTEIYDPFQPTEGEGVPGMDAGDEGDKYDPFEPTGSPASEKEMDGEQDVEEESSICSLQMACDINDAKEVELETTQDAEGPPPDSTETVERLLVSDYMPTQVNRSKHIRQHGKDRREAADSEHSEIEEGEIVGVAESRREREIEIRREVLLPSSESPSFLQGGGLKPERILRVLDGEGFVSVRAEGEWDHQPVPPICMGDLRRKLTNRRKQRFRSCPSSASISPPPTSVLPIPSPSLPVSQPQTTEKIRSRKSSKSSKEKDRRKLKGQDKEKRKKRKEEKGEPERASEENKEKDLERRSRREGKEKNRRRSSRSYSQTRKSTHHSTPEAASHSHNTSRHPHRGRSWSSPSEGHHRGRDRERDRDRDRERDQYRERRRDTREREGDKDSRMRERRKRDRNEGSRRSSSRERGDARRRRESTDRRDRDKVSGREREQDRRRDGRPVVPPSIQDLNGSDLFAIKRTITVTTTPPTTLVPTSPSHAQDRSRSPMQGSDKPRKRKRKRRRRSDDEEEHRSRSPPTSLSPLRYHAYEPDRLSDHPEPDMLSLDGEALDSDYPSLEDSPVLPPPPEPPLPSPKLKSTAPKGSRHHQKKKSRSRSKKLGQSESSTSSSSHRPKASKSKGLLPSLSLSLSASSGNTVSLPLAASLSSAKRVRKTGKDKPSKKELGRSGRSKKLGGCSKKSKLQSKVSVLVREGVSSTTGNSGKLGIDLLGPSGTTGPSVVGGSIAVVFRRDNESRSPFLKPCSEPLSLPGRVKDLNKTIKQRNTLSSMSSTNPTGLKSKKVKPSSTTSTSSSASSPTSSSVAKRRRRPVKKTREKGLVVDGPNAKGANSGALGSGWTGASDIQPGIGSKPSSPPSTRPGPTPSSSSSSSSSSSTSVLPPSSSPPHTPPLSLPPSRDTRESSPDSQTVDSSCKTPEPSFLSEDCSVQSQSTLTVPAKSPPSPPPSRGDGISQSVTKLLPSDDQKSSPPCSTSSALVAASLAHSIPPLAAEPSSSSSASVSSSTVSKPPPPPPPPSAVSPLPWSLQTGVDCTAGGVLALTALLFKMEEANMASRAKAQEFIQATSQILSQANQNQSQSHSTSNSSASQVPAPPSHAPPPGPTPTQFILHGSLPLVGCTKTPPSHIHSGLSLGGGCAQTPPPPIPAGLSGPAGGATETGWDGDSKDPDKYLKKLHTQERAVEEVKLAIKPYYQRKDINKDEYKDILRKAVHKICHSRTGEINPVKVSNLVKLYVQRYKYFRKHGRRMDDEDKEERDSTSLHGST